MPKHFTPKETARVLAINSFGFVIVLVCLVYSSVFYHIGKISASIITFSIVLVCLLPIGLNYAKKYDFARRLYVFFSPILILYYSLLIGEEYGVSYFFIVVYAFPFIFLKPTERGLALAFFIYNCACLVIHHFVPLPFIEPLVLTGALAITVKVTVFTMVIFFAFVLFYAFYQTIIKNEQRLIQTNLEIEKAHQIKQEFLATMSHELRTPLNAVVTITSLLDENPEHKDKLTFLKLLKHSSHNLLSIVNDILDFSKLEANKMKLEFSTLDIRDTLRKIVDTYSSMADEKGLNLVIDVDNEVGKTYKFDEIKLGQIIGNLISNAIKYTSTGEVRVHVEKFKSTGLFDELYFAVSDTGSGISAEDLSSIFESFTQIKSVLTRNTGGTGLGLAIVKRLLQLYGSDIGVESELNKGSKFYFSLNLKCSNKINLPENKQFKITDNKKILLVEDNAVNAMVAQKLLQNWGLNIETAANGQIAVEACQNEKFDVILMDLHMPVMDGFTATKTIREYSGPNKFAPIFALTADVMGENNQEYNKYFDGFITKPIQQEKLQAALMSRLSG